MKVAYAQDWLPGLLATNRQLQLAVGVHWHAVATLVALIASTEQLGLLAALPAVDVLAVVLAGSTGYLIIRLGEAELRAQAVDERGRIVAVTDGESLSSCRRLLLTSVITAGTPVARPQTA